MPNHYYIDNCSDDPEHRIPLMGYLLKCPKCGRKIIVDCGLIGTNHNCWVSAVCAECVEITPEWRDKHPEEAKQIDEFCGR